MIPKSQSPKSPQSQKFLFGPNLCQAQSLGPKLRPKSHFLQILNTRPTSKGPKRKLQKPCPNLQTQMMRKKIQPPVLYSNKMKTCVMDSHTLSSSNGKSSSLVKSLYFREIKGSKISKFQCKNQENSNFRKNGKMVISVKIQNFSRSRMIKQTSPLESSREI